MRRPEGHNIKVKKLNDKMRVTRINKPEKLKGLDQKKLEGSAGQNSTNNTSKHDHDSSEHTQNTQRRRDENKTNRT